MVADVVTGVDGQLSLTEGGVVLQRSRWRAWWHGVPQRLAVSWEHVEGALIAGDHQDELRLQVCGVASHDRAGDGPYVLTLRRGSDEDERAARDVVAAVAQRAAGPSAVPVSAQQLQLRQLR